MAKKGFGKLVVLAAAAGAAAAGISYLKKYHSFTKELEKDFHDFEGDEEEDYFEKLSAYKIILKKRKKKKAYRSRSQKLPRIRTLPGNISH